MRVYDGIVARKRRAALLLPTTDAALGDVRHGKALPPSVKLAIEGIGQRA
jgi:hypothetical protein